MGQQIGQKRKELLKVMVEKKISLNAVESFAEYLMMEEKSKATIEKYVHDIHVFLRYINEEAVTKEKVIAYKEYLLRKYKVRSVNSMLASLNGFFLWQQWPEFRVKQLKIQQQAFCTDEMELTRQEYIRLVRTAREMGNVRLEMIIQTICSTGIRISELKFVTVNAVRYGYADVSCKGKSRRVMIPDDLRKKLLMYITKKGLKKGVVFLTKSGNVVDRSNIWREMKKLSEEAKVSEGKIFPHNLRHLFARCFYGMEKDIAKLADVLGHSNINTTRIYMVSTGREHQRQLNALGLVV